MTERDAYVKMDVAHAKARSLACGDSIFRIIGFHVDLSCFRPWRLTTSS